MSKKFIYQISSIFKLYGIVILKIYISLTLTKKIINKNNYK